MSPKKGFFASTSLNVHYIYINYSFPPNANAINFLFSFFVINLSRLSFHFQFPIQKLTMCVYENRRFQFDESPPHDRMASDWQFVVCKFVGKNSHAQCALSSTIQCFFYMHLIRFIVHWTLSLLYHWAISDVCDVQWTIFIYVTKIELKKGHFSTSILSSRITSEKFLNFWQEKKIRKTKILWI